MVTIVEIMHKYVHMYLCYII